jgi:predicted RNA methylase
MSTFGKVCSMENYYSLEEVLQILGASDSTVKNWIKLNLLKPIGEKFPVEEVEFLKNELDSGTLRRFQSRANKTFSALKFIPSEYIDGRKTYNRFMRILSIINRNHLTVSEALAICALKTIAQHGLTTSDNMMDLIAFDEESYTHGILREEIQDWFAKEGMDIANLKPGYTELFHQEMPMLPDALGALYSALQKEGKKSVKGSYFTPGSIVDAMVNDIVTEEHSNFLDPCCGTGQFLLSAARRLKELDGGKFRFSQVCGYDKDALSVRIARINFLLQFKTIRTQRPNIRVANTLITEIRESYDVVATNPPWGAHLTNTELKRLRKKYPMVKSGDSFSYFIVKSLAAAKPGGKLSFLLPASFLYTGIHADIREYMLKNTTLRKIIYIERLFKRVFTPVLRIDFNNEQNLRGASVEVVLPGEKYRIAQQRFLDGGSNHIDIFTSAEDRRILAKTDERPHTTLAAGCLWALGIVTGNNAKHVKAGIALGAEPLVAGRDIEKFRINPGNSIVFEPEIYQQVADADRYYRAKEKLLYRFIGDQLVLAYDDKKLLPLNSANVCIPTVPDYPLLAIAALFNSTLYQFIYQKRFNSIKILRQHLEALPLPRLGSQEIAKLEDYGRRLTNSTDAQKRHEIFLELDDFVYGIFSLSDEERELVRSRAKISMNL